MGMEVLGPEFWQKSLLLRMVMQILVILVDKINSCLETVNVRNVISAGL